MQTASARFIGFDADDTLWHNENIFAEASQQFCEFFTATHDITEVSKTLHRIIVENIPRYGYGIKSYILSLIDTAIELNPQSVPSDQLRRILEMGDRMLRHPVELIDGALHAVTTLAQHYPLILITKGDLIDQHRKLRDSSLAHHFTHIEIISDKNPESYLEILERHQIPPEQFTMVGNSLKSDILPVITLGGIGIHTPYPIVWQHEHVKDFPRDNPRFHEIAAISELPALIEGLPLCQNLQNSSISS